MIVFFAFVLAAGVLGFRLSNDALFLGFMLAFVAEAIGYNRRRLAEYLDGPSDLDITDLVKAWEPKADALTDDDDRDPRVPQR